MRVLLLSNLFPSANDPTRGVFNLHRFRALGEHCEVRVVAPVPWWAARRRGLTLGKVAREDRFGLKAAFPVYWSIPRFTSLHSTAMAVSLGGFVDRLYQEFPFEAILAAWAYPDAAAAAHLAERFRVPLLTMVLGSDINEMARQPELRGKIVQALRRSYRVVAVSHALRDRVSRR